MTPERNNVDFLPCTIGIIILQKHCSTGLVRAGTVPKTVLSSHRWSKLNHQKFFFTQTWFGICICRFVDAGRESVDASSVVTQMNHKISVVCFQTIY